MPTRRQFLALSSAAAALPALAACGERAGAARISQQTARQPGQPVRLTFWTWLPLQKAVALWNKTHPDIHVDVQIIPESTSGGYNKMHAALRAGNAPDLGHVEYAVLPEFMLVNGLTNLSKFGGEKLRNAYTDWQWQQGVFGGEAYAIPQSSGPMGLFYRSDLFDRWDIAVPRTWDEFRQAARIVKKRGGDSRICSFPPTDSQWFSCFAWQRGARWVRTEGDTWVIDVASQISREVAEFWDGMIRDDLVTMMPSMQTSWYAAVQQGKLASWPTAQWCDAMLRENAPETAGKWRVAPLPQWEHGDNASANWGGSSVAVLQGSRHPEEAMEFAHWLCTNRESIDKLIDVGYGWPAAKDVFEGSALDKADPFFGNQRYNAIFQESDRQVDTSWRFSPTNTQFFAHLDDAFRHATASGSSLVDALSQAQPRMVDDLKAKGLKARAA